MTDELSPALLAAIQTRYSEDWERFAKYGLSDKDRSRVLLRMVIRMAEEALYPSTGMQTPQRDALDFLFGRLNDIADGEDAEKAFGFNETTGSQPFSHYRKAIADQFKELIAAGAGKNEARRAIVKTTGASLGQVREATRRERKPR